MNKMNSKTEGTTTVFKAAGMLQAIVMKEYLERSGVPVFLNYETTGYAPGTKMQTSDEININVSDEHAQEVKTLLETRPPSGEIFSVLH